MKSTLQRRCAAAAAVAALTVGGIGLAAGTASATTTHRVWMSTSFEAGVYYGPSSTSGKVGADDLQNYHNGTADGVDVDCWATGQNIENHGDVWYHVTEEWYYGGYASSDFRGWVYGAFVDGNAAFHSGVIPAC
ncbi:hypothetical protein [Streptacidiphilus anmyonensis]|uniref:hypothetical protein n=1 Tax=Streptacidiphilus anmyonensis TaxID=405782 RepID=UPI0005AA384D|nr:hypothetical protein [Streptacidiphilus anmyonensis]